MTSPASFTPEGRLDGSNATEIEAQLLLLLEQDTPGLVIDLSRLDYLSSAGLRTLLRVAEAARLRARTLAIAAPAAPIARVLQLSGFDRLMPVTDTVAQAIDVCRGP